MADPIRKRAKLRAFYKDGKWTVYNGKRGQIGPLKSSAKELSDALVGFKTVKIVHENHLRRAA